VDGKTRVIIVEDDTVVRSVLADYLRAAGHEVDTYGDGVSARDAARVQMADVLIVDRMLPGISGDELCKQVREYSDVPIVMLTALSTVDARIEGLEHGADDYVVKPFSLREVQLRIEAIMRRRSNPQSQAVFSVGRFRVDPTRRRIWSGHKQIALTSREYELFIYLARNAGRVVSRDEILREVWGWSFGDPSTVTVHVRRLREKIELDPRFPAVLRTEWGAGYRFCVLDESC
jgi:two-component system response regulator RegX3